MQYINYYLLLMIFINLILLIPVFRSKLVEMVNFRSLLSRHMCKEKLVEIDLYGVVMSVSAIASVLASNLDRIIINSFTNNAQVGIYSIAAVIGNVIGIFGTALAMIAHPLMAKHIKENDIRELNSIYKFTQKWSLIATIPVAIVFAVYSKSLLTLLDLISDQNGKYSSGAIVLSIIVFGQLINVGTGMCGGIISFSRYYKMDMYTQIFLVIISTGFNLAFIPVYGINGAAAASAASLAIYNIIKVVYVRKKFGILPFDKSILKVIAGSLLCIAMTMLLNQIMNLAGYYVIMEIALITGINYMIVALSGLSKGDIGRLKSYMVLRK